MTMQQDSERTYIVHLEASAAIGFEVECDAIDSEAAQAFVESIQKELEGHFKRIIDNLMVAHPEALKGYCTTAKTPLKIVCNTIACEPDDGDEFEVVEVSEAA